MIRIIQEKDIDTVAEIWLDTNISAHNFINSRYWLSNFEMVKKMLFQAEVYVYENNSGIQGFIGLEQNYIAGIFVRQKFQSHNIGKQLLDFAKTIRNELTLNDFKMLPLVKFYCTNIFLINI